MGWQLNFDDDSNEVMYLHTYYSIMLVQLIIYFRQHTYIHMYFPDVTLLLNYYIQLLNFIVQLLIHF
jgi:hypothetical protein